MCRLQPPKWPGAVAKNCRNCRDSNKIAADLTRVDVWWPLLYDRGGDLVAIGRSHDCLRLTALG